MADLTYLNDGSVLANLRDRYARWLIYVCTLFLFFKVNTLLFFLEIYRHIRVFFVLSLIHTNVCQFTR
jgi:myosin heavy subunit